MFATPCNDEEGLRMSRFWFANLNKNLITKRSHEELLVTMNKWSTAKQRHSEEVSTKIERTSFASNPCKLAVMAQPNKAHIHKIYKT